MCFAENPKLAVPREKRHRGLQCRCLRSEAERARQLFLASSLCMEWRRDSLIAGEATNNRRREQDARTPRVLPQLVGF